MRYLLGGNDMRNSIQKWYGNTWHPFREFDDLHREVDRMFGDFITPTRRRELRDLSFTPACDVEETESHYLLRFDVPGIAKEDIKIELVDQQLLISGERRDDRKAEKDRNFFSERTYGKFTRTIELKTNVDADKVEASYKDGVLHVVVPKAESTRPKKIKIQEGKGLLEKLIAKNKVLE
jgi:HSP20 family protein